MGEQFTSRMFCLQRKYLAFVSFLERYYPGKLIMWQFFICFPHHSTAAIQITLVFLLLYNHELSRASLLCASCHCCCCHPESEEFLLEFPSPRHLCSSICPLDLSGLGDPTGRMLLLTYCHSSCNSHAPPSLQGGDTIGGVGNVLEDILFECSNRSELTAS